MGALVFLHHLLSDHHDCGIYTHDHVAHESYPILGLDDLGEAGLHEFPLLHLHHHDELFAERVRLLVGGDALSEREQELDVDVSLEEISHFASPNSRSCCS